MEGLAFCRAEVHHSRAEKEGRGGLCVKEEFNRALGPAGGQSTASDRLPLSAIPVQSPAHVIHSVRSGERAGRRRTGHGRGGVATGAVSVGRVKVITRMEVLLWA